MDAGEALQALEGIKSSLTVVQSGLRFYGRGGKLTYAKMAEILAQDAESLATLAEEIKQFK